MAARLEHAPQLADRGRIVVDVLEHVVTDDDVERCFCERQTPDILAVRRAGHLGVRADVPCMFRHQLRHERLRRKVQDGEAAILE